LIVDGGVYAIRSAGTASPLAVREIHIDALKQPGAFSYPYEG
jgi:hypothetical protein